MQAPADEAPSISILHDQVSSFTEQVFSTEYKRARLTAGTLNIKTAGPIRRKPLDAGQGQVGCAAFVQQSCFIFRIEAAVDHPAAGIDNRGL